MLKVGQHWGFVGFVVNGGYYFTCSASAPKYNEWRIVPVIQAMPPMSQANYNGGIAWLEKQARNAS